jgi:uncharacterized protein YfaS (alpha-2-macroglobulin family)
MSFRSLSRIAVVAGTMALAACGHDHEDVTVTSARLEVLNASGAVVQTVTVTPNNVTGGPLALTLNTNATVRVTWLNAAGAADPANTDSDFEVRFNPPTGSGLTWTLASGSRTQGTMRGTAAQASVNVGLSLFHTGENHSDFDANIPVRVQ